MLWFITAYFRGDASWSAVIGDGHTHILSFRQVHKYAALSCVWFQILLAQDSVKFLRRTLLIQTSFPFEQRRFSNSRSVDKAALHRLGNSKVRLHMEDLLIVYLLYNRKWNDYCGPPSVDWVRWHGKSEGIQRCTKGFSHRDSNSLNLNHSSCWERNNDFILDPVY